MSNVALCQLVGGSCYILDAQENVRYTQRHEYTDQAVHMEGGRKQRYDQEAAKHQPAYNLIATRQSKALFDVGS
jgi:hypothetical protein